MASRNGWDACDSDRCNQHPPWPLEGELEILTCMKTCELCGSKLKGAASLRKHANSHHVIDPSNPEDPNGNQERFYDGVKPGKGGRPKLKVKLTRPAPAKPAPARGIQDGEGQKAAASATQERDAFVLTGTENEDGGEETSSESESDEEIFVAQRGRRDEEVMHIKTEGRA